MIRRSLPIFGLLCVVIVTPAAAQGPDTPLTGFFQGNAAYAAGDYAGAVQRYEAVAAGGFDGGNLRFNLANAYFKSGDLGRAILNYERAQLWLPGDPDLRANLDLARNQTGAAACESGGWFNLAFPLATTFSSWNLAVLASSCLAFLFLALALRPFLERARRPLAVTAIVFGLLGFECAASLAARAWTVERTPRAIVLGSGDTPVRFEPDEDGTVHFTVPQGAEVVIADQRQDWAQVARCDGRRGWIPANAVEPL